MTILNSQGETPAQAAQKEGFSVCVGYLVVVETCVSLAQQVVALKSDLEKFVCFICFGFVRLRKPIKNFDKFSIKIKKLQEFVKIIFIF